MPQFKVIFKASFVFPKGRISVKKGENVFMADQDLETVKNNSTDLVMLLANDMADHFKTGHLFGLDIVDIISWDKKQPK